MSRTLGRLRNPQWRHLEAVVTHDRFFFALCVSLALPLSPALHGTAADLRSQTVAAFDRYVAETERQREPSLTNASSFLWIEAQRAADQRVSLEQLRSGAFVIERLTTTVDGKKIDVPDGIIHHWLGAVFVPAVPLDRAIALLQDYDRHAAIYAPAVARSKILARDGDSFRVLLRFFMKKVITVVVDGEHEARFTRLAPDRAHSRVVSTRLNEVEEPGTDRERLKPEGRDGGYLWRINSYWRFLERDGGTYIQCETITLSRRIPVGLGWLVGPFVTSIPKDSLEFTLTTTRQALLTTVKTGAGRPR
jgi:hypothetical protein